VGIEWLIICVLAVVAVAQHLWWRRRCAEEQAGFSAQRLRAEHEHETAVAAMRGRQAALLDSMTEGLLLLDERGRIQVANPTFLRLFNVQGDVVGRSVIEAVRMHELAEMVPVLASGQPISGRELSIAQPAERWLEVNGAPVLGADGRPAGAVLVFHDLTRIKRMEAARADFVANVSHEIRTPLSLIQGYVETLLDGAKDDPKLSQKFLQIIERNTGRLRLLIEDLLVISELESGRVQLNRQRVELRTTVAKVLESFRRKAEAREATLIDECPSLVVEADPGRLEQVLENLLDNAIKYGRAGGTVTVGARPADNGFAEVFVRDDGPGIPPEALDRIFERFYRVDKARSREQGGTGLGLSIVKHIVQSHGGRSWAESRLRHGSTFYFTVPLAEQSSGA